MPEDPVAGVIVGSGMEDMFPHAEKVRVETDYGDVEAYMCVAGENRFAVVPRHRKDHSVPPHAVNYKANVQGFRRLGIRDVLATSAVGSISERLPVGGLGLLEQFVDFTTRRLTFFDKEPVHVDMTRPYDDGLGKRLSRTAKDLRVELTPGLVYFCVDGPRYETAAEIRVFAQLGADVVGMTGAPEAVLCREAGLRYASLVVATNRGAGLQERLSHEEVVAVMEGTSPRVRGLLEKAISDW